MRKLMSMAAVAAVVGVGMAGAQTAPMTLNKMSYNIVDQRVGLLVQAKFPIPVGEKITYVSLDCKTGKAVVEAVNIIGNPDPAGKAAQLVKAGAITAVKNKISVKLGSGASAFSFGAICKDKVVHLDFSDVFKKQRLDFNIGGPYGGVGIGDMTGGVTSLFIPLKKLDFASNTQFTSYLVSVVGSPDNFAKATKVSFDASGVLSKGISGRKEALFLYDRKSNTLSLIADAETEGSVYQGATIPDDKRLILYHTDNYEVAKGWRKITVDLKAGTIANEEAVMPAKAKFIQ